MRHDVGNMQEITQRLGRLNEEIDEGLWRKCGNYVGSSSGRMAYSPHSLAPNPLMKGASVSIGIGKIVVEFFSAAISTSVCR